MCSYNRINGEFASENEWLLTKVLRDEWGFDGFVVSDWGAVSDRVKGLKAGLDLEMPSSGGTNDAEIAAAVKSGKLDEQILDAAVERILKKIYQFSESRMSCEFDKDAHHIIAEKIAKESAVLLKNEGSILPLSRGMKIAFIGEFAQNPRFQGGGSSHINAYRVTSALDAYPDAAFARGYTLEDQPDDEILQEALDIAEKLM